MASMIKVTGLNDVITRLRAAGKKINLSAERGLVKGGQYLKRESQKIVPVMTGNLHASAFTRKVGRLHVIVGYTADYAAYVHEDLEKAHGKAFNAKHAAEIARANVRMKAGARRSRTMFNRGEQQQAKFLETPAREKRLEILQIVADEASRP